MIRNLPLFAFFSMVVSCFTAAAETVPGGNLREPMPVQWSMQPEVFQSLPTEDNWWQTLGDPVLLQLLDMAESNNFNLLATAKRIEAARQSLNEVRAAYFPTVSADAGWDRIQESGRQTAVTTPASKMSYFSLGLSAQWEIDLFGRVAANAKASRQAYNATCGICRRYGVVSGQCSQSLYQSASLSGTAASSQRSHRTTAEGNKNHRSSF